MLPTACCSACWWRFIASTATPASIWLVSAQGVTYRLEGATFEYYFSEFGCTGNVDLGGLGEKTSRDRLFEMLPPEGVLYDIGAHEGVYSITCKLQRPDITVVSFEPMAERLRRNLKLNQLDDSLVQELAVGDKPGHVKMVSNQRSSNHVADQGDVTVELVRIEDHVARSGLPAPSGIKLDVEGMEFPALRGAEQLLRQHQPLVMCEINASHRRYGVEIPEFARFMQSLGYSFHRVWDDRLEAIQLPAAGGSFELPRSADHNYWFLPAAYA